MIGGLLIEMETKKGMCIILLFSNKKFFGGGGDNLFFKSRVQN